MLLLNMNEVSETSKLNNYNLHAFIHINGKGSCFKLCYHSGEGIHIVMFFLLCEMCNVKINSNSKIQIQLLTSSRMYWNKNYLFSLKIINNATLS